MRILLVVSLFLFSYSSFAKVVEYELTIDYSDIEYGGQAMLVNKQYPAPTLYFKEGDVAKIKVNNAMDIDTSIHWHGLLVPPEEDGVPYLSNFPIPPKGSYTYRFPIKHGGTYWYHSHTNLQEQLGVHGAIVIEPKQKRLQVNYDQALVLQDWTKEKPKDVLHNLKKDGDYYALKKDSVISLWGYWKNRAIKNWFDARWMRMGGMDLSDVGYDEFLINGKRSQVLFEDAKVGDKIRLRFINTGASSYFHLDAAEGLSWQVIALDGMDVQALNVEEILIAPAETYDVLFTLKQKGSFEIRSTSQDGTGHASVFIGAGEKVTVADRPKPNLYASHDHHGDHDMSGEMAMSDASDHSMHKGMDHSMHKDTDHSMHKGMDHGKSDSAKNRYSKFKSLKGEGLPEGELREVDLRLTGDMESYNWSFNNIPLTDADKIKIKRGEVVRFNFINETMMHHPLHLHGHFFRVVSGNGNYDPVKHTVDVAPLAKLTIEFFANERKDWFFHCHNLYHAKTGMARVISYGDPLDPALMEAKKRSPDMMDDDWYYAGELKTLDDFGRVEASYFNRRHGIALEATTYDYEYDMAEFNYVYNVNRWTDFFVGVERIEDETEAKIGFEYVLPLLIDMELSLNEEGDAELALETEIQWTKRFQSHIEGDSEERYHLGLEYRFNERLSLETAFSNDVDYSAGLKLRF